MQERIEANEVQYKVDLYVSSVVLETWKYKLAKANRIINFLTFPNQPGIRVVIKSEAEGESVRFRSYAIDTDVDVDSSSEYMFDESNSIVGLREVLNEFMPSLHVLQAIAELQKPQGSVSLVAIGSN